MRREPIQCGFCARDIFSPSYTHGCRWCQVRRHTRLRHQKRRERRSPLRYLEPGFLYGMTVLAVMVAVGGIVR